MNAVCENLMAQSEAAANADFSLIRYGQCWEDADVLLQALDIQPGDACLSIASAGDNTLAMLARGPERVIAVDLNCAQLACLELRVAAYRELEYDELLGLIGSRFHPHRERLYQRCRKLLSRGARGFWDARPAAVANGIGGTGKFERYFKLFRDRVLPLVHSRKMVDRLLRGGTWEERRAFHDEAWDTWRWRLMFKVFFSRAVMGRMGRDPSFFNYVEGPVATRILQRARHALIGLNPADNPYLQWILTGCHTTALPFALRAENFETIRNHVNRLEWHRAPLESFLETLDDRSISRFNLSDIFEYMSAANHHHMLERLVAKGRSGGRLVYWNTLADRHRPDYMADKLRSLLELSRQLHAGDKAFFYCAFIVEEIV
jgi:S-adenosylmethionine-diacylglycerol 3-amino-3-carboxypropyl transferase